MQSCLLYINSKMLPRSWLAALEGGCYRQSDNLWREKKKQLPAKVQAKSDLYGSRDHKGVMLVRRGTRDEPHVSGVDPIGTRAAD